MTSEPQRPETIERLGRAVYPSLAMLAGMELDLFTPLKDGPMTNRQLADALDINSGKLRPLLYSLVAAGLLEVADERFSTTPESQKFLVQGSPDYLGGRRVFFARRWSSLLKMSETVRTGIPQGKIDYSTMTDEQLDAYYRSIYSQTVASAKNLLARFDFSAHRHLVDVGGGSGGLAITIAEACPGLQATVMDQPNVIPFTQRFIEESEETERVHALAADVVEGDLSGSYDAAVLSAFLPVLSPQQAGKAIKNVANVIEPGGVIYIVDGGILDDSRLSPDEALAANLGFINQFDQGEAHTEGERRQWLTEAGFEAIRRLTVPNDTGIMIARKPK
ncbi:MAG: methyltransferase [Dehalococcoidia bacterium]